MTRIIEDASRLSFEKRVGRQHRHFRSLDGAQKRLDAPIELVVTDDPGVVAQEIEEIDHHPATIAEREFGPLIDVANVDQD